MGNQFLDQYSLLHFAVGNIAYFWGFDMVQLFLGHIAFELAENTQVGMDFINKSLTWWPGGKPRADEISNIVGDNISALLGWWCAAKLDEIGKRRKWY